MIEGDGDLAPRAVEVLSDIHRRHGLLDAETVVAEARPKNSPLHRYFDWDNKVAGERWRLEQARQLIRRAVIVIGEPETKCRAFVHVRSANSYEPVEDVWSSPSWAAEVEATFRRDADAFAARWKNHRAIGATYRKWLESQLAEELAEVS